MADNSLAAGTVGCCSCCRTGCGCLMTMTRTTMMTTMANSTDTMVDLIVGSSIGCYHYCSSSMEKMKTKTMMRRKKKRTKSLKKMTMMMVFGYTWTT